MWTWYLFITVNWFEIFHKYLKKKKKKQKWKISRNFYAWKNPVKIVIHCIEFFKNIKLPYAGSAGHFQHIKMKKRKSTHWQCYCKFKKWFCTFFEKHTYSLQLLCAKCLFTVFIIDCIFFYLWLKYFFVIKLNKRPWHIF